MIRNLGTVWEYLIIGGALGLMLGTPTAAAQGPLWPTPIGTVALASSVSVTGGCPALGRGFYSDPNPSDSVSCWSTTVSGCIGDDPMSLYYEVDTPPGTLLGTIVMLSGGTGIQIPQTFAAYVQAYLEANYQVIEVSWGIDAAGKGQPWEVTTTSGGLNSTNASIGLGACRVATLLNWMRNGNVQGCNGGTRSQCGPIWAGQGGMCVHGNSAGAGAVAYVLTYYHGGYGGPSGWSSGYIDKFVSENGPVFSDVQQGCEYQNGVNSQSTYICAGPGYGVTEPGCNNWPQGQSATLYSLEYDEYSYPSVNNWSGSPSPSCGMNTGSTTQYEDYAWNNMSIVAHQGNSPSFNYPNTAISAWLCSSVASGTINNSGSQAQLYFAEFANAGSGAAGLSVNGVSGCPGNEEVEGGTVLINGQSYSGSQAIINDMLGQGGASQALSCNALGVARQGH